MTTSPGGTTTSTPAYNPAGQTTALAVTATTGKSPPAGPARLAKISYNPPGPGRRRTSGGTTVYLDGGAEQISYSRATRTVTGLRF